MVKLFWGNCWQDTGPLLFCQIRPILLCTCQHTLWWVELSTWLLQSSKCTGFMKSLKVWMLVKWTQTFKYANRYLHQRCFFFYRVIYSGFWTQLQFICQVTTYSFYLITFLIKVLACSCPQAISESTMLSFEMCLPQNILGGDILAAVKSTLVITTIGKWAKNGKKLRLWRCYPFFCIVNIWIKLIFIMVCEPTIHFFHYPPLPSFHYSHRKGRQILTKCN